MDDVWILAALLSALAGGAGYLFARRTGRNPATGEAIKIPAKKVVKFRVAKSVKDAIVPPKKAK